MHSRAKILAGLPPIEHLPGALPIGAAWCPEHGPHPQALTRTDANKARPVRRRNGKVARRGVVPIDLEGPTVDYFKDLTRITDATSKAIEDALLDQIEALIPAEPPPVEEREAQQKQALEQLDKRTRPVGRKVAELEKVAREIAGSAINAAQRTHKGQQRTQLQQIGVSVFTEAPELRAVMRSFVGTNTTLIRSLPTQQLARTKAIIADGIRRGRRQESVARDIAAEFGIAENRAALIARDQIGKANADLSRHRMQANGVTKAVWRTVSSQPRPAHAAREGRVYKISRGLSGVRPGDEPNCQCYAEPLV